MDRGSRMRGRKGGGTLSVEAPSCYIRLIPNGRPSCPKGRGGRAARQRTWHWVASISRGHVSSAPTARCPRHLPPTAAASCGRRCRRLAWRRLCLVGWVGGGAARVGQWQWVAGRRPPPAVHRTHSRLGRTPIAHSRPFRLGRAPLCCGRLHGGCQPPCIPRTPLSVATVLVEVAPPPHPSLHSSHPPSPQRPSHSPTVPFIPSSVLHPLRSPPTAPFIPPPTLPATHRPRAGRHPICPRGRRLHPPAGLPGHHRRPAAGRHRDPEAGVWRAGAARCCGECRRTVQHGRSCQGGGWRWCFLVQCSVSRAHPPTPCATPPPAAAGAGLSRRPRPCPHGG